MRNDQNFLKFLIFLCAAALTSCSGTSYSYINENSSIHSKVKIPAGATDASVEFSVVTNNALPLIESDYPTISFYYSADARTADKLKKLEVRLIVDDKELTADETEYSASHFYQTINFTEAECCENLGKKLSIGENKSDFEYGFGVHIVKKYKSLKRLPEQLTVAVSATTDKGTVEKTKTLSLKAYQDSNFIRVH